MNDDPRNFLMMPNRVVGDNELRRVHFQVLAAILGARNAKTGLSIISYDRISNKTRFSRREVIKAVSGLIDGGYVRKIERGRTSLGRQLTNAYKGVYTPANSECAIGRPGSTKTAASQQSVQITDPDPVCKEPTLPSVHRADGLNIPSNSRTQQQVQDPFDRPDQRSDRAARNLDDEQATRIELNRAGYVLRELLVARLPREQCIAFWIRALDDDGPWFSMVERFREAIQLGTGGDELERLAIELHDEVMSTRPQKVNGAQYERP